MLVPGPSQLRAQLATSRRAGPGDKRESNGRVCHTVTVTVGDVTPFARRAPFSLSSLSHLQLPGGRREGESVGEHRGSHDLTTRRGGERRRGEGRGEGRKNRGRDEEGRSLPDRAREPETLGSSFPLRQSIKFKLTHETGMPGAGSFHASFAVRQSRQRPKCEWAFGVPGSAVPRGRRGGAAQRGPARAHRSAPPPGPAQARLHTPSLPRQPRPRASNGQWPHISERGGGGAEESFKGGGRLAVRAELLGKIPEVPPQRSQCCSESGSAPLQH